MEKRKRLLAMLLAFTLVLTYMPALAFAESPDDAVPAEETAELTEEEPSDGTGDLCVRYDD